MYCALDNLLTCFKMSLQLLVGLVSGMIIGKNAMHRNNKDEFRAGFMCAKLQAISCIKDESKNWHSAEKYKTS